MDNKEAMYWVAVLRQGQQREQGGSGDAAADGQGNIGPQQTL